MIEGRPGRASYLCLWGCHDQGYRTHELARDAFIEHECRCMRGQ